MISILKAQRFCGREFGSEDISLIHEVVTTCGKISRQELAYMVCELLDWKRANGKLKERECRNFLEFLECQGVLKLPGKKLTGSDKPRKYLTTSGHDWPYSGLAGSVEMHIPLSVRIVKEPKQRRLFQEIVSRYHYLGYAMPLQHVVNNCRFLILAMIKNAGLRLASGGDLC